MLRFIKRLSLPFLLGVATTFSVAAVLSVRDRDAGMRGSTPTRSGDRLADAARNGTLVPTPLSLTSPAWARTLEPNQLSPHPDTLPPSTRRIQIDIHRRPGVTLIHSSVSPFSIRLHWAPAAPPPTPEAATRGMLNRWQASLALPWLSGSRPWPAPPPSPQPPFPPNSLDSILIKAAGWPLPSAAAFLTQIPSPALATTTTWHARGGIIPARWNYTIGSWTDWRALLPGVIPLRPLWTGFILNTALYSLAWYILLSTPRFLITSRRRRRGCCIRCAYSRSGLPSPDSPCPECGSIP